MLVSGPPTPSGLRVSAQGGTAHPGARNVASPVVLPVSSPVRWVGTPVSSAAKYPESELCAISPVTSLLARHSVAGGISQASDGERKQPHGSWSQPRSARKSWRLPAGAASSPMQTRGGSQRRRLPGQRLNLNMAWQLLHQTACCHLELFFNRPALINHVTTAAMLSLAVTFRVQLRMVSS